MAALKALSDPATTTVIRVTRPDKGAIVEASRTSEDLRELGLNNQRLAINGVFHASDRSDPVAFAIENLGRLALDEMPQSLKNLPQDQVPLRAFDTVGLPALRALLSSAKSASEPVETVPVQHIDHVRGLAALAAELAAAEHGLIMVVGKGGVGKTTVAAALALGLIQRGKSVHLSTTDPAAHLSGTLNGDVPGLHVSRIDPKVETQRYVDKIMAAKSPSLDAQEQALLLEDLRRASVEPYAWVLNKSVLAAGTRDPLLAARLAGERKQIERMSAGLTKRLLTLPWLTVPPIGFIELSERISETTTAVAAQTWVLSPTSRRHIMYGFTTTLTGTSFDQALAKTIAALKAEGFGVLSDIDVQHAMKEKMGVDMPPYRILGACNPPLAHQALQAVSDIGLLLPCNVIVREEAPDRVVVGFLDPQIMVKLVGKPEVKAVADAAEQRLRRACQSLGGSTTGPT